MGAERSRRPHARGPVASEGPGAGAPADALRYGALRPQASRRRWSASALVSPPGGRLWIRVAAAGVMTPCSSAQGAASRRSHAWPSEVRPQVVSVAGQRHRRTLRPPRRPRGRCFRAPPPRSSGARGGSPRGSRPRRRARPPPPPTPYARWKAAVPTPEPRALSRERPATRLRCRRAMRDGGNTKRPAREYEAFSSMVPRPSTGEARAGIEPANSGFADRCLTTWLPRRNHEK